MTLDPGEHTVSIQTIKGEGSQHALLALRSLRLTQAPSETVIDRHEEKNPERVIDNCRPHINLPWGALAHPDGRHILISGLPGYGRAGGGMAIYDIVDGSSTLLTDKDLVEHHSPLAMEALPNGDIIACTTVSGTHGGRAVAREAVIFVLDWETKKVKWQTVPIPGLGTIRYMEKGSQGKLFCMGSDMTLFVFDPEEREVIHRQSLDQYGGLPSAADCMEPDGNGHICLLCQQAIVRIDTDTYQVQKVADAPGKISAGIGLLGDRVYFGIGSHLWSVRR